VVLLLQDNPGISLNGVIEPGTEILARKQLEPSPYYNIAGAEYFRKLDRSINNHDPLQLPLNVSIVLDATPGPCGLELAPLITGAANSIIADITYTITVGSYSAVINTGPGGPTVTSDAYYFYGGQMVNITMDVLLTNASIVNDQVSLVIPKYPISWINQINVAFVNDVLSPNGVTSFDGGAHSQYGTTGLVGGV
jgi:hypothetical protein